MGVLLSLMLIIYTLSLAFTHLNVFPILLRFFAPLSCILPLSVRFYFRFNAIFLCLLCTKFACVCCWILWFYVGSPFTYISRFHMAKPIKFSSCAWSAAALLLCWYTTHLRQKSSCVYCKCWHRRQQDKDSKKSFLFNGRHLHRNVPSKQMRCREKTCWNKKNIGYLQANVLSSMRRGKNCKIRRQSDKGNEQISKCMFSFLLYKRIDVLCV